VTGPPGRATTWRRPLSANGRAQAEALAQLLGDRPVAVILSGPAKRCVATVEPLAAALDVPVEVDSALAEGTSFEDLDRLLTRFGATDVLLCSHADVIGAALTALWRRGHLAERPNARKVVTWVVDGWPDPARVEQLDAPMSG
jgi:8-oxo-(d)GTP phosphatase